MRRTLSLLASALLIGTLAPGQARGAAGGTNLPVQGTHSGYMTVNLATGLAHALTTGDMSQFGATTVEQDVQIVPTGPTTNSFTGTWTMTVASGDQLFGTSSGTSERQDAIHSTIVGRFVSTGGTGRLAGVTVEMDASVEATVISVDGTVAMQAVAVAIDGRLNR